MGVGRVCSVHDEWCADGKCRWCEPPAERTFPRPQPCVLSMEPRSMGVVTGIDLGKGVVTITAPATATASPVPFWWMQWTLR